MGQMLENTSWPESMQSCGPGFNEESWRLGQENTPQNDLHEDETQNEQTCPQLAEE